MRAAGLIFIYGLTGCFGSVRQPRPRYYRGCYFRWKAKVVEGQRRGHTFGHPDLFIAAIAALEDLIVVTRDIGAFVAAGVPAAFDPRASTLYAYGERTPIPASAEAIGEILLRTRPGR